MYWGVVNPKGLVKEAKIALGEELSFEQLYELYKKKKKDYDVQQKLLGGLRPRNLCNGKRDMNGRNGVPG